MSFALSWEPSEINAGGFLYFDAVVNWNRSFSGTVTEHPIDSSGSITDHYISANPTFQMSAVISGSDLSMIPSILVNEIGDSPSNARTPPSEVQVTSTDASTLMKYLPNVIGQFLPDKMPSVVMDGVSNPQDEGVEAGITEGDNTQPPAVDETRSLNSTYVEGIQDLLESLVSGEGINQITGQWETLIRPVFLYETDGFLTLIKKLPAADNKSLILTNINFREDTDTGRALFCDMTFRLVRFANIKKISLPPELVQAPVKKKVATKKSLSRCDSTKNNTATSADTSKAGAIDDQTDTIRGVKKEINNG